MHKNRPSRAAGSQVEKLSAMIAFKETDSRLEMLEKVRRACDAEKSDALARICFRIGLKALHAHFVKHHHP